MDPRVKAALDIIESEINKPLLVNHLAARVGLCESRFEQLFKRETGHLVKAHIREIRLTKAKSMLSEPSLRIKEVASAVGYKYAPNFTRDFRKCHGKTPSQYRNSVA